MPSSCPRLNALESSKLLVLLHELKWPQHWDDNAGSERAEGTAQGCMTRTYRCDWEANSVRCGRTRSRWTEGGNECSRQPDVQGWESETGQSESMSSCFRTFRECFGERSRGAAGGETSGTETAGGHDEAKTYDSNTVILSAT